MTKVLIIKLIMHYAALYGVNGDIAVAVAQVESNLNPVMVGDLGEVGLYQLRPEYVQGYTAKQLLNPETNIKVGVKMLADDMKSCKHKKNHTWVICHNLGRTGASKVKYPELFPYYKKINIALQEEI